MRHSIMQLCLPQNPCDSTTCVWSPCFSPLNSACFSTVLHRSGAIRAPDACQGDLYTTPVHTSASSCSLLQHTCACCCKELQDYLTAGCCSVALQDQPRLVDAIQSKALKGSLLIHALRKFVAQQNDLLEFPADAAVKAGTLSKANNMCNTSQSV